MSISTLLLEEVHRRIFGEGFERIHNCFARLTDEQIWQRPNEQLSSMGNLVLHLCGNVRQWVLSGLGDVKDTRQRSFEFSETGPISRVELFALMEKLKADVEAFLKTVDENQLTQIHNVQGFEETGLSILVHVTEHFSYHVGQIAWYTKLLKDEDLGFYGDVDLEQMS